MKNKISIVLAGVLISVSPMLAKVGGISVDELSNKDKFKEFHNINKKVVESFIDSRSKTNKVGKQEILHYNKKAVGRVYHLKPSGYVVATLNKNDVPIKAHSFNGDFNKLPEEYKEFLSARLYEYSQITEEIEKNQKLDTENKKNWEYLETYTEDSPKPIIESNILETNHNTSSETPPELPNKNQRAYDAGDVLVDVQWSQNAPYNNYTQLINGTRAPTGCTNTAWAQIMKFHEWPVEPEGVKVYNWNGTVLTRDLSNPTRHGDNNDIDNNYNWFNMPSAGNNEVATLIADIGYVLGSNWMLGGTEAVGDSTLALQMIARYFGYSTAMNKVSYSDFTNQFQFNDIRDAIEDNIDSLQPLWHAYDNGAIGHATVIDGYQNLITGGGSSFEVHINVGWGNVNNVDDFYAISRLSATISDYPAIDPITSMRIVSGIRPCNGGSDCHSSYTGGRKNGLTLQNDWNLVSLISSGNDIDSRDFTNDPTSVQKFNHITQSWVTSGIIDIQPLEGVWVKNIGTTEYVFPGAQTEAVELTTTYLSTIKGQLLSGKWALIGTGKEINDNRLGIFNDYKIFNNGVWVNSPSSIPAGSGIWVQR